MIRRLIVRVAATMTFLSLPGCASHSYFGISLVAAQADPELRALAKCAQAGDKHAQLELGIKFEEGRGMPVDLKRALMLYRMAATDSGGTLWIYSPSVGNGTRGRVVPIGTGPRQAGLREAKRRLEALGE